MWFPIALCLLPAFAFALAKGECGGQLDQCLERASRRPVCGTDNKTYPTRCHLLRTKCNGSPHLYIKHRGKCSEKHSCWTDELRRGSSGGLTGVFVPKCLPDGSYAPVQCHAATGFCWCVTTTGKPIPNTSVRQAKPVCNRKGKGRKGGPHRGKKNRKDCGRIERSNFLRNLVKSFKSEYNETTHLPPNYPEEELTTSTLNWKFAALDLDKNNTLSRLEYKELRKQIKVIGKPRKCARFFVRICDVDRDMFISQEEWSSCLKGSNNLERGGRGEKPDKGDLGVLDHEFNGPWILPEKDPESEVMDCLTDRKGVLEEQKLGNSETYYVPECTADGRYQKTQCYKSTGYCWCVYEDSGKPIPGTSVKDLNPKCDAVQAPSRPMKGCPDHRKQVFLRDLIEFLTQQMTSQKAKDSSSPSIDAQTEKEKIATWNFMTLDMNKNKVLERKEWKTFRALISNNKKLRRCGKKLPRYCDVNRDRKISLTEWLNCLDAQRVSEPVTSTSVSTPLRKNGFGPMDILKEYD